MIKKERFLRRTILIILSLCLFCSHTYCFAQEEVKKEEVFVIETEFDIDQLEAMDTDGLAAQESSPSIKPMVDMDGSHFSTEYKNSFKRRKEGLNEEQIIQLNRSLKKLIEENEKIIKQNEALDRQLRNIKGQRTIEVNRVENLSRERDGYKKRIEEITNLKDQIEADIVEFKDRQKGREKWLEEKVMDLEEQLAKAEESMKNGTYLGLDTTGEGTRDQKIQQAMEMLSAEQTIVDAEKTKEEVLSMIDDINEKKRKMKIDKARIHYNMGNAFFGQGKYQKAIAEYKKTIVLTPNDANAHFNLAFISGDFRTDYKTALNHYRKYLVLKPDAEDINLVKEKILEAELFIKSHIDSRLEEDLLRNDTSYLEF